mgnify:CR=1 FL=1
MRSYPNWPEYLMIRDTGLHDDQGGLGQRIYTTAGAGYKKVRYVREDLASAPAPASGRVDAATPSARWRAEGKPDPHGSRFDVERAKLIGGNLTDDEVAHQTAMLMRSDLNFEAVLAVARDRIRWLSRQLEASLSPAATPVSEAGGEAVGEIVMFEGVGKEVSWRKGKMPPAGTKLYPSADDLDHFHAARAAYFAAGGQRHDPQRDQKISDIQTAIRDGKDGALAKPASSPAGGDVVREALAALLDHVDRETCTHEETHRGGFIWTICDQCGRKWADDQGGFVPHTDPPAVARARLICEGVASQSTSAGRVGE